MSLNLPPDVHQLVQDRLATGHYTSEEEVLRAALLTLADEEQDLQAIQEAIAEIEAGAELIPLEEAFRRISGGEETT